MCYYQRNSLYLVCIFTYRFVFNAHAAGFIHLDSAVNATGKRCVRNDAAVNTAPKGRFALLQNKVSQFGAVFVANAYQLIFRQVLHVRGNARSSFGLQAIRLAVKDALN